MKRDTWTAIESCSYLHRSVQSLLRQFAVLFLRISEGNVTRNSRVNSTVLPLLIAGAR